MQFSIQNRNDMTIVGEVDNIEGKTGLVFVAHGLTGNRNQDHIRAVREAFEDTDYTVMSWDAVYTIGDSEGTERDASLTSYYEDMQDVIDWAQSQDWYEEPFIVSGHSLGGACSIMYATDYPDKVKAAVPLSAFLDGEHYYNTYDEEELEKWKETGIRTEKSSSRPGLVKELGWSVMEDISSYQLYQRADDLQCPTLMIVGSEDNSTPASQQRRFLKTIPHEKKELMIIESAPHTYNKPKHLEEIKVTLTAWIEKL